MEKSALKKKGGGGESWFGKITEFHRNNGISRGVSLGFLSREGISRRGLVQRKRGFERKGATSRGRNNNQFTEGWGGALAGGSIAIERDNVLVRVGGEFVVGGWAGAD